MKQLDILLEVMARLRDPDTGCRWDRAQSYQTLVHYTLEEAYEVADAIARHNLSDLKKELGDLLFQIVFYAQIAKEQGVFDFAQVAAAATEKMIRRHPHVFGQTRYANHAEQSADWERIKAVERLSDATQDNIEAQQPSSILDGIAKALPAMKRAIKLQQRAARVGFDWPSVRSVFTKLHEELAELQAVIDQQSDYDSNVPLPHVTQREIQAALLDELGDVLFVCTNLARHLCIDPEQALYHANAKFERRFRHMETLRREALLATPAAPQRTYEQGLSLEEWDHLWEQVKRMEGEAYRESG